MTTRREFLKQTAATGVLAATSGLALPALAEKLDQARYVSPQTGPLAAFSEADKFVIETFWRRPGRWASIMRLSSKTASPIPIVPPR